MKQEIKTLDSKTRFVLIFTQDDSNATQSYYAGNTYQEVYDFMINEFFEGDEDGLNEFSVCENVWEIDGKIWEIDILHEISQK